YITVLIPCQHGNVFLFCGVRSPGEAATEANGQTCANKLWTKEGGRPCGSAGGSPQGPPIPFDGDYMPYCSSFFSPCPFCTPSKTGWKESFWTSPAPR